jgi:hypothetical protein
VLYFAKHASVMDRCSLSVVRGRISRVIDSEPRTTNNEQLTPGRIWNPNEILELSDRASIYADPRTMA